MSGTVETSSEVEVFVYPTDVSAKKPMWGLGRRKSAVARVRLFPGDGKFLVNGRLLEEFFRLPQHRQESTSPLIDMEVRSDWDVLCSVNGGGLTGQAGAIRLGVARALAKLRPDLFAKLKVGGHRHRDARISERKKYGRRGARRGFQFSKR